MTTTRLAQASVRQAAAILAAQEHGVGTLRDDQVSIVMTGTTSAALADCQDENDFYLVSDDTSTPDPFVQRGDFAGSAQMVLQNGHWLVDVFTTTHVALLLLGSITRRLSSRRATPHPPRRGQSPVLASARARSPASKATSFRVEERLGVHQKAEALTVGSQLVSGRGSDRTEMGLGAALNAEAIAARAAGCGCPARSACRRGCEGAPSIPTSAAQEASGCVLLGGEPLARHADASGADGASPRADQSGTSAAAATSAPGESRAQQRRQFGRALVEHDVAQLADALVAALELALERAGREFGCSLVDGYGLGIEIDARDEVARRSRVTCEGRERVQLALTRAATPARRARIPDAPRWPTPIRPAHDDAALRTAGRVDWSGCRSLSTWRYQACASSAEGAASAIPDSAATPARATTTPTATERARVTASHPTNGGLCACVRGGRRVERVPSLPWMLPSGLVDHDAARAWPAFHTPL